MRILLLLLFAAALADNAADNCGMDTPTPVTFTGATAASTSSFRFTYTDALALNAWVTVSATSGTRGLLAFDTPGVSRSWWITYNCDQNTLGGAVGGVAFSASCGATVLNDGAWHQVSVAWSRSTSTVVLLVDQVVLDKIVLTNVGTVAIYSTGCLVLGQIPGGLCGTAGFSSYLPASGLVGSMKSVC